MSNRRMPDVYLRFFLLFTPSELQATRKTSITESGGTLAKDLESILPRVQHLWREPRAFRAPHANLKRRFTLLSSASLIEPLFSHSFQSRIFGQDVHSFLPIEGSCGQADQGEEIVQVEAAAVREARKSAS